MDNIIFIGTNNFANNILKTIIEKKNNIKGIFTKPQAKIGRGKKLCKYPVQITAENKNINLYTPENINSEENIKIIKKLKPSLIIIVEYNKILSNKIINIPTFGSINIHPSLLPKFRGPSPIQYAILEGEKESGISIIKINKKIDSGKIINFKKCKITKKETFITLYEKLCKIACNLIIKTIKQIKNNKIVFKKQNNKKATYAPKIEKKLLKINWDESSCYIERKIRALISSNQSCFTIIKKNYIKILSAVIIKSKIKKKKEPGTIIGFNKNGINVSTKDNIIRIKKIQFQGKKPINSTDIFNSKKELFIKGSKFE